ncbi:hypothetical protein QC823_07595 [Halomonas vilamensis]|uniref:Uncharacterized protein n=1 Tax=Vreelandella vilamensis TaxID=531309 RepID=A0ABU1H3G9_9GAMM|nr:hypothetical protein [Halomonas vilamensis]MDR5898850.1 hypothetical protein [Halomonas vilamensis]
MTKSMPESDAKTNGNPLQRLKGSVHEYQAPFDPVGVDDWEALQQEDLTSNAPVDKETKRT